MANKKRTHSLPDKTVPGVHRPTPATLYQEGQGLRTKLPRAAHAQWKAPADRADPITILEESSQGRIPHLIPVRYGRMMQTPFTWYRGSALQMAADLAGTPTTGVRVQACGDCHLLNFGAFATPERRVIMDINDLDETLPAPWEWDVKRLATSFILACRNNRFSEEFAREAAVASARAYREKLAEFSTMRALDVWYASIDLENLIPTIRDKAGRQRVEKRLAKARARSIAEDDFPSMVMESGAAPVIKDNPPLIYHVRDESGRDLHDLIQRAFARYRESLPEHLRVLLDRYELIDTAMKVVGVGSVGTWCAVMLLMAGEKDPLFLQVKEARPSVLERYAGKSAHANHGQRIVVGSRLMQPASDLFLGWTEGDQGRHFFIRQLRDMKIKPMVEVFNRTTMVQYAEICGWCVARAHARSGDPAKISGYLGKSDAFDEAIGDFSVAYADQTERDHAAFMEAIREGRVDVATDSI